MQSNLEIYNRMFVLLNRIYPALTNFPKAEKYALCQDIKNTIFDYLGAVSRADKVKSLRLRHSQDAEAHLTKLKTLIKLTYNRKYLSRGFFEVISLELTEISKMLAGYIRAIKK